MRSTAAATTLAIARAMVMARAVGRTIPLLVFRVSTNGITRANRIADASAAGHAVTGAHRLAGARRIVRIDDMACAVSGNSDYVEFTLFASRNVGEKSRRTQSLQSADNKLPASR